MDSTENVVGFNVPVPTIPPTFDDSSVVTVDDNVAMRLREKIEGADEELESNGFGPSNVALGAPHALPVWVECPSTPPFADDDCNAHARAGIRKS